MHAVAFLDEIKRRNGKKRWIAFTSVDDSLSTTYLHEDACQGNLR
jgi:hypothetical protein